MLLRASGQQTGTHYNLRSVTNPDLDPGVPHAQWLRLLSELTLSADSVGLTQARQQAADAMGAQSVVDALIVAAAFNGITRVADATGIPLDDNTANTTQELREHTGITHFDYAEKEARYS